MKRNRLEQELQRKDFHCPLGEDFGSNAPAEIALSMIAQLLRERDKYFKNSTVFTDRA
jgi:xanthine dehydrogenase accessory factor